MQAGARVKEEGLNNNLIDLIKGDKAFCMGPEAVSYTHLDVYKRQR